MKCDIIIPVYNAYESLIECIDSVIKNTDLKENGLIIINDKSTDERISKYLKKIEKDYSSLNLQILENEENLGFVGTVNRGMNLSSNDVLLLNSDTEVPKNWLNNIKKCAYSGEKIATVTPLSNNATLVSVPKGLQKNDIPTGFTFEEYAKLVEDVSFCSYPELPTAHGFCMYIKREVLNELGYFDEESFGKGYGEENDFSFRCLDYGYRNILCDNVIVLHKESQSFNESREKLVKEHEKILEKRYPLYVTKLRNWCLNFPLNYICDNIEYNVELKDKSKKNVLVIIHDWESLTGGTTLHVKDIVNGLKDKINFHILSYTDDGYKLYSNFSDKEKIIRLKYIEKTSILPRYNNSYKEMLCEIIESLGIEEMHIHHMMHHYFDLVNVIEKYNINTAITLHDFYSICPTINMLYEGHTFCENLENKNCSECLKITMKFNNNILNDWHNDWNKLFSVANNIIVPSNDTKKRINKVYKDIKIKVIEHGINIEKTESNIKLDNNNFNVAYVGVLSNHKGLYKFKKLIEETNDKSIKYHLFGKSEDNKLHKNKKNYIYHGKYKRDNIVNILKENNINLVCFLQIWPETYSYTVSEVIASGIPILSYDIGAGADRVKENNLGWTIPLEYDVKDIENKILEIKNNENEYQEKIKSINKYKIKNINEMNLEYKKIYLANKNSRETNKDKLAELIKNSTLNYENAANAKLEAILNSTKWKLVNKISFSPKVINMIRKIIYKRG